MVFQAHPVVAVDRNGQVISYYESITEAARINGSRRANISRSVINRTLHKGVLWLYEKDYRELWFEGRLDELHYSVRKIRSESARKGWSKRTRAQREAQKEACRKKRLEYLSRHKPDMEKVWSERCKPVLCISTGKVYESASAFARVIGVDHSAVTYAIRNGRKTKGMIVKYITKEEYEQRRNKEKDSGNADRPPVD